MLILLERERPWFDASVLEPSRCNSVREKWSKPFKRDLPLQIGSTGDGKIRASDPYGTDEGFWAWALFAFDDAA